MVLWEMTLATAYFLGLKRTYGLALKIQRRIISPKHHRIRQIVHSRTRAVFDVALKVHQNIQQRDIEVGRNLGNRILRCLDRMKPSAQIRGPPEKPLHGPSTNMTHHGMKTSNANTPGIQTSRNKESDRHLFSSSKNIWPKPYYAIVLRHPRPAGTITQYRQLQTNGSDMLCLNYKRDGFDGVLLKDIMQWMRQK